MSCYDGKSYPGGFSGPGGICDACRQCPCQCAHLANLRSQAPDQALDARMAASQARMGALASGMEALAKAAETSQPAFKALSERPPLGLRPRECVRQGETPRQRFYEIAAAIYRYASAGKSTPAEWLTELIEVNGKVADLNGGGRHGPG